MVYPGLVSHEIICISDDEEGVCKSVETFDRGCPELPEVLWWSTPVIPLDSCLLDPVWDVAADSAVYPPELLEGMLWENQFVLDQPMTCVDSDVQPETFECGCPELSSFSLDSCLLDPAWDVAADSAVYPLAWAPKSLLVDDIFWDQLLVLDQPRKRVDSVHLTVFEHIASGLDQWDLNIEDATTVFCGSLQTIRVPNIPK